MIARLYDLSGRIDVNVRTIEQNIALLERASAR